MAADFLFDFFCKPILEHEGYNLVNTLTYAAILLAVAFGFVLPWLKKEKLALDNRFLLSLLSFVLLGSSFRILEDLQIVSRSCNPFSPGFYTITPGIYILVGILSIAALWISLRIHPQNQSNALKIFGMIGLILALPILLFLFLQFRVWNGVAGVLILAMTLTLLVRVASKWFSATKKLFDDNLNAVVFFGQMLDASATFVSIQFYHCTEQHVLSAGIINWFGPFGFVVVKFALMLLVLYYTDKEVENVHQRNFIKLLIAIIGFAPGTRDTLTLGVGTCL